MGDERLRRYTWDGAPPTRPVPAARRNTVLRPDFQPRRPIRPRISFVRAPEKVRALSELRMRAAHEGELRSTGRANEGSGRPTGLKAGAEDGISAQSTRPYNCPQHKQSSCAGCRGQEAIVADGYRRQKVQHSTLNSTAAAPRSQNYNRTD